MQSPSGQQENDPSLSPSSLSLLSSSLFPTPGSLLFKQYDVEASLGPYVWRLGVKWQWSREVKALELEQVPAFVR